MSSKGESYHNTHNITPQHLEIQAEIARLTEQYREGIERLGGAVAGVCWTPGVGLVTRTFPESMGIGTHTPTGEIRLKPAQLAEMEPEKAEDMRQMLDFLLDGLARTHRDLQVCKGQLSHIFGNKEP